MIGKSPRSELLQVAEAVAKEKGLAVKEVILAMEDGLKNSAQNIYGKERDVNVFINPLSGDIRVFCKYKVVSSVENEKTEIDIKTLKKDMNFKVGDFYEEDLPPLDYGRISAKSARDVIFLKVKEAERRHLCEELEPRVGEIVNVYIKHIEFGDVFLDLNRAEAVLRKDHQLPRENFRSGERIRALLMKLRPLQNGPLAVLSRTHPDFLKRLFEQEIPEVYDRIIEIKSVARDPGSRSKVAVYTRDTLIDPIGACVGPKGNRIQAIIQELKGERIDVIHWSSDLATFVVNALAPAEVSRVVLDEENNCIEVAVPRDQLSLAIGRGGQNVRLATQLTGLRIDIVTEEEDTNRRSQEFSERVHLFRDVLQIDEIMAQFLVSEGFSSIEDIAFVDQEEFRAIEGLDQSTIDKLQKRALSFIQEQNNEMIEKIKSLGVDEALLDIFSTEDVMKLAKSEIKTFSDLADLDYYELSEILDLEEEEASQIIMQVRDHFFNT